VQPAVELARSFRLQAPLSERRLDVARAELLVALSVQLRERLRATRPPILFAATQTKSDVKKPNKRRDPGITNL
jgi:hypothetical protein